MSAHSPCADATAPGWACASLVPVAVLAIGQRDVTVRCWKRPQQFSVMLDHSLSALCLLSSKSGHSHIKRHCSWRDKAQVGHLAIMAHRGKA